MEITDINILDYLNYNSKVTLTMFFISLFVLVLDKITRGKSTRNFFSTERASLLNPLTYIRLFTHVLGHRDWEHFSNNYLIILLLGPLIEEKYGSINLLIMILITAFVVGVVNFIKGKTWLKGASSISFMLIVLSAFVNMTDKKIPLTLILIILFYIIEEIRDLRKDDTIAHDSHLVGGICGGVFGFVCINESILNTILDLVNKLPFVS